MKWSGKRHQANQAFTLTELVVVLAVITVLGSLLLPALAATHDRSNRALCQNNLRQIGVVTMLYAGENNGKIVPARLYPGSGYSYSVQIAINTNAASISGMKQIGLPYTNAESIWTCPDRPGLPLLQNFGISQWTLGYQYFGGVAKWNISILGVIASRSPTNMATAKPYWTLAADAVIKFHGAWQSALPGTGYDAYQNLPPHRTADSGRPQGGNQVFCDGSVQWINVEKMYRLTTWDETLDCFFYQNLRDYSIFTPNVLKVLSINNY